MARCEIISRHLSKVNDHLGARSDAGGTLWVLPPPRALRRLGTQLGPSVHEHALQVISQKRETGKSPGANMEIDSVLYFPRVPQGES